MLIVLINWSIEVGSYKVLFIASALVALYKFTTPLLMIPFEDFNP